MKTVDFSLNDFEIKTIRCKCPKYILDFEKSEAKYQYTLIHTRIIVSDLNNDYCGVVSSFDFDPKSLQFSKKSISDIVNFVNSSSALPVYGGGLCPEIVVSNQGDVDV